MIRRLAIAYHTHALRKLPPKLRQNIRTTLVVNGAILRLGGVLFVAMVVLLGLESEGTGVFAEPRFWAFTALGAALVAVGWFVHRLGVALLHV